MNRSKALALLASAALSCAVPTYSSRPPKTREERRAEHERNARKSNRRTRSGAQGGKHK